MPRIKSAIKRVEIAERNRLRNKATKSTVRTVIKKVFTLADSFATSKQGSVDEVQAAMSLAFSKIDKAVKTGVLHRNTAARRKSRLARKLSELTPKP